MDKLLDKVKRILFTPKTAWDDIKAEESTQTSIIKDYLLYLVAIPIVANFIGQAIIGYPLRGDRVNFFRGLIWAVFAYVLYQVSLYVSAMVVNALAPQFESTKNSVAAFKLVAYSMKKTPKDVTIVIQRPSYALDKDPHPRAREIGKKVDERIMSAIKEGVSR